MGRFDFCNPSSHEWILPGAAMGRFDFCNPSSHEKPAHLVSVDSVVVTEQIAGLLTKGHRFPQLLHHPGHRGMRRHSKMHNLSTHATGAPSWVSSGWPRTSIRSTPWTATPTRGDTRILSL